MPEKKKKKTRRPRKNQYFTKVHEDAIIKYSSTSDNKIRTELYIKYIGPVFDEMVDKIVYTYKFTTLPNIEPLKEECKIWLTTILDKFDPSTGSKAFSYFSVITKNWFIHKVKKNSKKTKSEVTYDEVSPSIESTYLAVENQYMNAREKFEFMFHLNKEMENWTSLKLKDNERKVLEAVKLLMASAEEIEIFNKKAIYLYIRELTGLNTKQIVNNLNRIRQRYRTFKVEWEKGSI